MTDPTPEATPRANRSRWVAVIAVLALVGGIAVAASQWSKSGGAPGQTPAQPPEPQPGGPLPEGHPPIDGSAGMPAGGKLPVGHPPLDAGAAGGAMPAMPPTGGDPGYVSVEGMHALIKAGLAPTNRKVWVEEVEGVDVSGLSARQRELFLRYANSEDCICGYTLASCRAFNPPCPGSPPRVSALLDSVRTGKIKNAEGLRARPKVGMPAGHPSAG